jgi:molybdate transport system permease protein
MDLTFPLTPLGLTLKVAFTSTLLAFLTGVPLAFLVARKKFWGRELLDSLVTLPLVLPPTVIGYYLIVVWGRNGWLGHWLQEVWGISLMFTWQGAVLAAALVSFPLVFKAARAAFEEVDQNQENVARTLGLSEIAVFRRVSLPLALRGILAGTMLALARSMGEFGATLMLAGNLPGKTQTLALAIYDAVQAGNDNLALSLVVVVSGACILILLTSGKILRLSLK